MDNTDRQSEDPLFSIIIPCRYIDADVVKCAWECGSLPVSKEIKIITDNVCPGYPAQKRNWAIERAKGKYLAFIDADAFPTRDWLTNSLIHFEAGFSGVCGPGIIPSGSSILEHATDLIYKCLPYAYRVTPRKQRIVAEFPTFNLIVRKDKAPRFKDYLTGEDTLFCRELEGLIIYDPKVVVYHKRRPLFKPFWKQIKTYGIHRGHLIRLAVLGLGTTIIVYGTNFFKGLLKRRL
jgi:hypothetical protein